MKLGADFRRDERVAAMHSKKRRGAEENSPQSALDFLRGSVEAVPGGGTSRRVRFEREVEGLRLWSAQEDCRLTTDFAVALKPVASGAEHDVFFAEELQSAIKITRNGRFGHSLEGEGISALPSEYLRRLIYHNELFGDRIAVCGVMVVERSVHLVSRQPWIKSASARPVPEQDEIDEYFAGLDFSKSDQLTAPAYYHRTLNVAVLDAHPLNVLRDENGRLVPIDVVVGKPSNATRALLGF
jgi:hypothetical protein